MKTLLPVTAVALVGAVNFSPALAQGTPSGFAPGTQKAQEVPDQSGLREILAALAAGRNVSARVGLPFQLGFFNGQTALSMTPDAGADPDARPSTAPPAPQ